MLIESFWSSLVLTAGIFLASVNAEQLQSRDGHAGLISLGSADKYTVFASTGIATIPGVISDGQVVQGDIGVGPIAITAITGYGSVTDGVHLDPAFVTGKFYGPATTGPDGVAEAVLAAYKSAFKLPLLTANSGLASNFFAGDKTLSSAGVYQFDGTVVIDANTIVSLSGKCGESYVFVATGAISIGVNVKIQLKGGLTAATVFWVTKTVFTTGIGSSFAGKIISGTNVVIAGSLVGGVYSQTEVALQQASISLPTLGLSSLSNAAGSVVNTFCANCAQGSGLTKGVCTVCVAPLTSAGGISPCAVCLDGQSINSFGVCVSPPSLILFTDLAGNNLGYLAKYGSTNPGIFTLDQDVTKAVLVTPSVADSTTQLVSLVATISTNTYFDIGLAAFTTSSGSFAAGYFSQTSNDFDSASTGTYFNQLSDSGNHAQSSIFTLGSSIDGRQSLTLSLFAKDGTAALCNFVDLESIGSSTLLGAACDGYAIESDTQLHSLKKRAASQKVVLANLVSTSSTASTSTLCSPGFGFDGTVCSACTTKPGQGSIGGHAMCADCFGTTYSLKGVCTACASGLTSCDHVTGQQIDVVTLGSSGISLGNAANFAIFASTGISSVPGTSDQIITGDVGVGPITINAITGFGTVTDGPSTTPFVIGSFHGPDTTGPSHVAQDVQAAYQQAARLAPTFTGQTADYLDTVGTLSIPGVYRFTGPLVIGANAHLVINGNCGDVFVIQSTGAITISAGAQITVSGGLTAATIYWVSTTVFSTAARTHFTGIILAGTNVVIAGSLVGAIYAQTEVALQQATVTSATTKCSAVVCPSGSGLGLNTQTLSTGVCSSCVAGYYSTALVTTCSPCSSPGTVTCDPTTGITTLCSDGYILSSLGSCSVCGAGHVSTSGDTSCTQCSGITFSLANSPSATCMITQDGYAISVDPATGLSLMCGGSGYGVAAGVCTGCSPNYWNDGTFSACQACLTDTNSVSCDNTLGYSNECLAGYGILQDGTYLCTGCGTGQFNYGQMNFCQPCYIDPYLVDQTCNPVSGIATGTTCVDGFYYISGQCSMCGDPLARTCADTGITTTCIPHYEVYNNKCVAYEYALYAGYSIVGTSSTYVGIFTCELSCGAACSQNAAATGLAFSAFSFRTSLGLRGESIGDCTCYNSIIADQSTIAAGSGSVDTFFLGHCGPPIIGFRHTVPVPCVSVAYLLSGCVNQDDGTPCQRPTRSCSSSTITCYAKNQYVNAEHVCTLCIDVGAASCGTSGKSLMCDQHYILVDDRCQPHLFAKYANYNPILSDIHFAGQLSSEALCAASCFADPSTGKAFNAFAYGIEAVGPFTNPGACYCKSYSLTSAAMYAIPGVWNGLFVGNCDTYPQFANEKSSCEAVQFLNGACINQDGVTPCKSVKDGYALTYDSSSGNSLTCLEHYKTVNGLCEPYQYALYANYNNGGHDLNYAGKYTSESTCAATCIADNNAGFTSFAFERLGSSTSRGFGTLRDCYCKLWTISSASMYTSVGNWDAYFVGDCTTYSNLAYAASACVSVKL